MLVKAAETLPEGGEAPGAFRSRLPLPVARMARAHGTLRADALHEREGLFPGQRRRGGVLRSNEDGIRLSRALGETHTRRGAHPDRRLHPLVQPRAHQTVAWLDESCTIPSKPGNGCVIISKKMSAAPREWLRDHLQENVRSPLPRFRHFHLVRRRFSICITRRSIAFPDLYKQRTNAVQTQTILPTTGPESHSSTNRDIVQVAISASHILRYSVVFYTPYRKGFGELHHRLLSVNLFHRNDY